MKSKGLKNVLDGISEKITYDFFAIDLREVLDCLGRIIGDTVTDDIVKDIFSRFCIGK